MHRAQERGQLRENASVFNVKDLPPDKPVLIAGPTASGKSDLALRIAQEGGGVIINADASQIYACWRVVTARPSVRDEALAPHRLYGHVPWDAPYSAGHWLRDVLPLLNGPDRPIFVGGTGLYFKVLTEGLAEIPETPADVRAHADRLSLPDLLADLDPKTMARIDKANRARVQRAWEVQTATGRGLADWQDDTPPPPLPLSDCVPVVMDAPKEWLNERIFRRFDHMIEGGALQEIHRMQHLYDPSKPSFRAIGVPELMAHCLGHMSLDDARERASISTRQFAKRQRTWFRKRMRKWNWLSVPQN